VLNECEIYIDDSTLNTPSDILSKCRKLKREQGLDLIMIDYLQLMYSDKKTDNRQQEVSEISRMLKEMARELKIPVIALSQLSRQVESREDKRPMMSDLRESGAIEQDADIIIFLYREGYYDQKADKQEDTGIVEINIAKHRNGPTGKVSLALEKNYSRFSDLALQHQEQLAPTKDLRG
jgi:replicative DNA helicase